MNQQEREVINGIFDRLQQAEGQPRDAEAEALIRERLAAQPGAAYLLAQITHVQEQALVNLNERVGALESELARAKAAPSGGGGFLSSLFGASTPPAGANPPVRDANPSGRTGPQGVGAPTGGPWGNRQNHADEPGQPGPWGNRNRGAAGGGFLASAMTTAAGVAGGLVLGNVLANAFGLNSGGAQAAEPAADQTPSANETSADTADTGSAAHDGAGYQEASYNPAQDGSIDNGGFETGGFDDFGGGLGGDDWG